MFSKILKRFTDILIVLLIIFLAIYFILRIMGVAEIYLVKTGSMEDGIHVGDYILIYRKDEYKIGDIVTYEKGGYHVTHRIIKKNGNKIVTKGDANNIEDDEINVKSIVGKVIYSGGYLNFIIDYKYALASALLALYLFSCYFSKKNDETIDDAFLSEINIEEETKENVILSEEETKENVILSEEETKEIKEDNILLDNNDKEEIAEDNVSFENNDKEEIVEDIQIEEKTDEKEDEKIKKDLSFIYEDDKKQEKGKTNNKKKEEKRE